MSYDKINHHACSAGCVFAFKWKGMSTNGGCTCTRDMNLHDRQVLKKIMKAYKDKINELEDELANIVIEEELTDGKEENSRGLQSGN